MDSWFVPVKTLIEIAPRPRGATQAGINIPQNQEFCITRITPQKRSFLRKIREPKKRCPKRVKPLSKLILAFGFAKVQSAVEFREGS